MTASYIEVPGTGDKLQAFLNTINSIPVKSEAVTNVDSLGQYESHRRDTNNEQTTPLLAGQVFTGQFTKVDEVPHFEILYAATTPFTVVKEWSNDGVTPLGGSFGTSTITQVVLNGYNVAYDLNEGRNIAPYYRLKVTNGTSDQTEFPGLICIIWLIDSPYQGSFSGLDSALNNLSKALLTRSVVAGQKSGGTFGNVALSEDNRLKVQTNGDFTIFGSQVVETPNDYISVALFTNAEMEAHTFDASANGGSTASVNANLVCSSGTATNGDAHRKSKSQLTYLPGHEGRGRFTAIFDAATAGAKQQIGFESFDGLNAIYLEKDGTSLSLVHIRNGSLVTQDYIANWNGELATSFTKAGVVVPFTDTVGRAYQISFGYLGYLGIELSVWSPDKIRVLAHRIYYDNEVVPLASNVSFSMFSRVVKTSGTTNVVLKSASWEGASLGQSKTPLISAVNSTATALSASAVFTGDWISHESYTSLELIVTTDQLSATNGIEIQSSERGDSGAVVRTTTFETFNAADISSGFKKVVTAPSLSFTRIVYRNGGSSQGSFFMQLRLHKNPLEQRRSNIESDVNSSNTAIMSRGLILAKNDSGTYGNITRGPAGGFRVAIKEHEVDTPIKALTNYTNNQANVGTTAVQIIGSPLTGRKTIAIKALAGNNAKVYVGKSGVTTGNGFELNSSEGLILELDATVSDIYAISATGTQRICWVEIA